MDLYWIWLSTIKGIGPVTQRKLLSVFGTPERIYLADREELIERTSLRISFIDRIMEARSLERAKKILDSLNRHHIRLLNIDNERYPAEVHSLSTMPVLLYYRGNIKENSMGVAVIGSRRCTKYGKQVTLDAATFLAEQGIPVISGMAKGIDGYAHTACLKAGGYTIAFLANGLDLCYPPEHRILMDQIIEKGAVISPYPPKTRPLKANFYKRNALMSAWSRKVLVVEAGAKSGALITAKFAGEQKRTVLAVPNSIYSPESIGANKLISRGAEIFLSPNQLLPAGFDKEKPATLDKTEKKAVMQAKPSERQAAVEQLSPLEKKIMERLNAARDIEELVDIFNGDMAALLDILCTMELEGKIEISHGRTISGVTHRDGSLY
jgi:DNA processing protein